MEVQGLDRLPHYMRDTAKRYVLHGISGGSFFTALVSNDLVKAFSRADEANTAAMRDWAAWLHNYAPVGCWGSVGAVGDWIRSGGLVGKTHEAAE